MQTFTAIKIFQKIKEQNIVRLLKVTFRPSLCFHKKRTIEFIFQLWLLFKLVQEHSWLKIEFPKKNKIVTPFQEWQKGVPKKNEKKHMDVLKQISSSKNLARPTSYSLLLSKILQT